MGDIPPPNGAASPIPDAVNALRRAIASAEATHGANDTRTAELRARLTRILIELGRDAEAAGLEAGTLGDVVKGVTGPHDRW